jgi:hypothetical protein
VASEQSMLNPMTDRLMMRVPFVEAADIEG